MKNKYQVSISAIKYYCGHFNKAVETAISNLQELVNRDKPKKAIKVSETERIKRAGYTHKCPVCKSSVGTITISGRIEPNNYCCFCGQHLDWSKKQ